MVLDPLPSSESVLREYVGDLLVRMADHRELEADAMGVQKSVAFLAHKEVRDLTDERLLPFLIAEAPYFTNQFASAHVNYAVFHLGKKSSSRLAYDFLVDRLLIEKRAWPAEHLLDHIREFPHFPDRREEILCSAFRFLDSDDYGLLRATERVFNEIRDRRIVDICLAKLDMPKLRPYKINILLGSIALQGDASIIEQVLRFKSHKHMEVRLGLNFCLARLAGPTYTTWLAGELKHPSPNVRDSAMTLIEEYGNEEALDAVVSRLDALTARQRTYGYHPVEHSPVYLGVKYLLRVGAGAQSATRALKSLRGRRWSRLFHSEQAALVRDFPEAFRNCVIKPKAD